MRTFPKQAPIFVAVALSLGATAVFALGQESPEL